MICCVESIPPRYTETHTVVNARMNYSFTHSAPMGIQHTLQALMERAGENPNSLSEKTGVPQPTIWRILNGTSQDPRDSTVTRLARFFRVTNDQLRGRGQDAHESASAPKVPYTPQGEEMAKVFAKLSKRDQLLLLALAHNMAAGMDDMTYRKRLSMIEDQESGGTAAHGRDESSRGKGR